ncbi:MAG: M48 family metallopeptidase [Clostridium sp.]|nr:M48 family metallopeptidase [Clostridium sp.]
MKKFLLKTFLAFSLIFIFLFSMTMVLENKNKKALQSKVKVECEIRDGEIIIPQTPDKVAANYEFTKLYFYSGIVLSLILPILFYIYGGIGLIKRWNFRFKIVEGGILFIVYYLFNMILMFPKSLFSSFYRGRLVGLSNLGFLDFLKDYIVSDSIDLLISLPIVAIIYVIFLKRKSWYFLSAVILISVSLIGNYIYPYFDEAQNDLVPMEEGELKSKIIDLSKEAGIENLDIKVIPKSGETNSMNAYMTGINNSRRIVFWDTTLNGLSEKEVLSVAAHEMGHHNLMRRFSTKDYRKIEKVPYILFILNVIGLLFSPIETAYSRKMEVEADTFAMEITNDGYTNGALEIKFIESNLTPVDVDPVIKWLAYDHPTCRERIELSNEFIKKKCE